MLELVDKAEALGPVELQNDPDDCRAKIIVFTPAGLRMLDQQRKEAALAERRMAAVTAAAFVAELRAQLTSYVAGTNAVDIQTARVLMLRDNQGDTAREHSWMRQYESHPDCRAIF